MLQKWMIALGFALALILGGCAPPQGDVDDQNSETETEEPAVEEAEAEPAPPPKPAATARPAAPTPPPAPAVCTECGTVASIEPVKEKGAGSGAGAVIGAIAGGVIGHQFGGGSGKDAATAAGAIAGGVAGHEVEKRARGTSYYRVGVNMESGSYQTVNVADPSGISVGSKVRVVGNNIHLR